MRALVFVAGIKTGSRFSRGKGGIKKVMRRGGKIMSGKTNEKEKKKRVDGCKKEGKK